MTEPRATEIPGLYTLPIPTPFPIGRINTYLALGDPLTLIDTGVNSSSAYNELVQGLASLHVAPGDLERIIITHHHTDHIGLVERLAGENTAEVWCHPQCVPYIEDPEQARGRLCEWSLGVWQEGGAPQTLLDVTGQLFDWFGSLTNRPVPVTGVLNDGDSLDLLGLRWQVLHTPGHAGDLICLYQPEEAALLSSDHLIRDVSSNALVEPPSNGKKRPRRLLQYMEQLQRVADLEPRIAYSGHGKPVIDVAALVTERLAFHHKRAENILAQFGTSRYTLFEMTERLFPYVSEQEKFLALSEVLGHLDWLERDRRIARETVDGRTWWFVA